MQNPIDIRLKECLEVDSNYTTYGMMHCEALARDEWDVEMNKYYHLLIDTLNADEKEKFKVAQRQWLKYRDKEFEFSATMHYNMQGTMWRVVAAARSCEIVKARALELKDYFETLTFHGQEN
ncbi:MAG: DUF1311 domain-containing protein [Chitinophagaceae bacterium]|nr:DUF1311 domain-containing protein [Chitinophagaceae bacterium]